jgi:hypothetical protein
MDLEDLPEWERLLAAERHLQELVPGAVLLGLASDEVLAQVLDRGEPSAWRALYALAREDLELRSRIARIARLVATVPPPISAVLALGARESREAVDFDAPLPAYAEDGT